VLLNTRRCCWPYETKINEEFIFVAEKGLINPFGHEELTYCEAMQEGTLFRLGSVKITITHGNMLVSLLKKRCKLRSEVKFRSLSL
jgi:hypothetical protein